MSSCLQDTLRAFVVAAVIFAPAGSQAAFVPRGLSSPTGPALKQFAGTDIIRILPPGSDPVAVVNPPPQPAPTPQAAPPPPPPAPEVPKPAPETPPRGPGRLTLVLRLGSLPQDPGRGSLGAKLDSIDTPLATFAGLSNTSGVLVTETEPARSSVEGGLRVGDIVTRFNGSPVTKANELRLQVAGMAPNTAQTVEVWRFLAEGRNLLAELRTLADNGNADMMYRLGQMHANGNGVPRDNIEAVRWYRLGAAAGNIPSTVGLASMLIEGRGVDQSLEEGVRLLRTAVDAGNNDAIWQLATLMLKGKAVGKDPRQALQLLTKAAGAGHASSMVELGLMYDRADGVPQNDAEAAQWYKRAADLGHSGGMVNLGLLTQYGRGVAQDDKAAVALYQKSADLDNAPGMANLGGMYMQGRGVKQDDRAAAQLYRRAAELGHAGATHNYAFVLEKGRGVDKKDPERAAELMMRALSLHFEFSYKQMTESSASWSVEFRRSMQRRLNEEGVYTGPLNGEFGPSTKTAITAIYNRNNPRP